MNLARLMNSFIFALSILAIAHCKSISDTSGSSTQDVIPPPPITDSFVKAENGNFTLDGKPFRFAGTNAYYLPNYEKIDRESVDQTLRSFVDAGISVVRIWGFYDGPPQYDGDITFQPQPGVYSEGNLRYLDDLIARGKKYNIRFIIAFSNYWDALGGMPQYNAWDGNPNGGMAHFISDATTQTWYQKYIYMLLNRVNSATGIAYKNEPAIFSWEIMNEARLPGADPTILRDWYQKMARLIKSQDSNHMVSTGEEGFESGSAIGYSIDQYTNKYVLNSNEGTSYRLNTAIPEIDYGSAHWYPDHWGFGNSNSTELLKAQRAWLTDHARIAQELGKPFLLGEYGFSGWGDNRTIAIYNDLWAHAEAIQLDGSLLWQLTIDYVKCYEFGGNICWPGGRQDRDLYFSFRDHIRKMNNLN